ncbi:glycosyltransferase [Candidatus Woesearchaeota archaeon]|nr:glycosyltransferase [Candidatus Woesearchaeota archaeon]
MMDVSIILPCMNKSDLLEGGIHQIQLVMNKTNYKYEIIISEDGSTDGTDKIADKLSKKYENVIHLHSDKRLGRGKALSNGIKKAKACIVGFIDPDLQIPFYQILILIEEINKGYDIVNASRTTSKYDLDFRYYINYFLSISYRYFIKILFNLHVSDVLSNCKFFNKTKILPILDKINDHHWFWDTELLVLANKEGLKMKEIPVKFFRKIFQKRKKRFILLKTIIEYFFKTIGLRVRVLFM